MSNDDLMKGHELLPVVKTSFVMFFKLDTTFTDLGFSVPLICFPMFNLVEKKSVPLPPPAAPPPKKKKKQKKERNNKKFAKLLVRFNLSPVEQTDLSLVNTELKQPQTKYARQCYENKKPKPTKG